MLSSDLKSAIKKVIGKDDFDLQITENQDFGDFSSNVALVNFDKSKAKNPREYAQKLADEFSKDVDIQKIIEKVEVAGPGFINFWLKTEVLQNELKKIADEKDKYGKLLINSGKLAIVEYSSPNIAKPFTIGHLRSTIIGSAVANLLESTGWKVMRDNHLGDWGTQFGKQIYAIKAWGNEDEIEKSKTPVKGLVALYVKFHQEAEKNPELEDKAREWFKKLEDGDAEAKRLWQKCIDWSWAEFNRIYKQLDVSFSNEFNNGRGLGESFFEDKMAAVIDELEEKKLLKQGDKGAKLVFFGPTGKAENGEMSPIMILKKDGASLYATRDLATDKYRKETYKPDLVVNEVGAEQSFYFKQIFEVESLLGWYKKGQRVHVGHGLIRFKEGKMSTRKGNTIWLEEVLSKAYSGALELATKSGKGKLSKKEELEKTAKVVGIGALKWNDLKRDPKTDIVFDWNEILNMEGNSGPYLQYTFARANSVLEKAGNVKLVKLDLKSLNKEELNLVRSFPQFNEVIVNAAKNYSPNLLANYLYNLAQKFNTFYNANKIIGSNNVEVRVAITTSTAQIIKNGLKILGIETLERM